MILPLLAIWGGTGVAKDYDGSFTYDIVSSWTELERTDTFSILIDLKLPALPPSLSSAFFTQGIIGSGGESSFVGNRGVFVGVKATGAMFVSLRNSFTNRVMVDFTGANIGCGTLLVTYDGSSNASGVSCFQNGAELTRVILEDSLTATILQPTIKQISIGATYLLGAYSRHLDGEIGNMQVLDTNYAGTQAAADAMIIGSFQDIVSDARFLLDIEFNKTTPEELTTRTNTPTYTITGYGGNVYVPFTCN